MRNLISVSEQAYTFNFDPTFADITQQQAYIALIHNSIVSSAIQCCSSGTLRRVAVAETDCGNYYKF